MVTVLQQVYFQNKKQQAFLSLIVLNIFQQCILPGINAKSSYDHLIKSQYTKEISSLVLLVSQQKKDEDFVKMHKEARLFAFLFV